LGTRGNAEVVLGNAAAAIPCLQRAIRLDKAFARQGLHFPGTAYLLSGQHEIATQTFRERIGLIPTTDLSRGCLASALVTLVRPRRRAPSGPRGWRSTPPIRSKTTSPA